MLAHGSHPFDAPVLLVVTRFRVRDRAQFAQASRAALALLAQSPGFLAGSIGQSTDETDLLVVTTRWSSVGAYRKALQRYDVKLEVVPWLSTAIDESSAYELVFERSHDAHHEAVSGRAADADEARLGEAAALRVPPVEA